MADEQKEPMTRERATKFTGETIRWLRADAERHNEVAESIERGFPMKMVYESICDISRCWADALQYLLDENERLTAATDWSPAELLTFNDLIDHAKDFSAENAIEGRTAMAGCWRTQAEALTKLRDGRAKPQEGESAK